MTGPGSKRAIQETEERQERRLGTRVAGMGLVLCALLVLFFVPADFRVSHNAAFLMIVGALGALGLTLIISNVGEKRL